MMKNRLILFCLLIGQLALAQEQNSQEIWQTKKNELIAGSGAMFRRYNGNNNSSYFAPVWMYKRKINNKNHFLRLGMFVNTYSFKEEVPFKIETSATNMKLHFNQTATSNVNFNLSYEWQKYAKDNKRLRYTYGLGLMLNHNEEILSIHSHEYTLNNGIYEEKTPTNEPILVPADNTTTATSVGGLGYVSLDYVLGKRWVLGLQANYMMGYTLDTKKVYANAAFLPTLSLLF